MKPRHIQILGLLVMVFGLAAVVFLYITAPRSLSEVTTKGRVVLGTYEVDKAEFDKGLLAFRNNEFSAARASFDAADPDKRDSNVQFYIAYSFYRQGWGRFSNDDNLFAEGVKAVDRVIAIDPTFRSADPDLRISSAAELKKELADGLEFTASDLDPRRLIRERK